MEQVQVGVQGWAQRACLRRGSCSNLIYLRCRLHVVLNTHAVIKEAWLSRGLDFQDRNPALLGNDYVDFIDGERVARPIAHCACVFPSRDFLSRKCRIHPQIKHVDLTKLPCVQY